MLSVGIRNGNGNEAKVTSRGELIVSPLGYSESYAVTATVNNQGYNFTTPGTDKRFVITAILLTTDKNVGANGATISIYEASSATETTVDKEILTVEMLKQTNRDITGLNLIVTEGKWLNVKTDDNNLYATVLGYYIEA